MLQPTTTIDPAPPSSMLDRQLALRVQRIDRQKDGDEVLVLVRGELSVVTSSGIVLPIGRSTLRAAFPQDPKTMMVAGWLGLHGVRETAVLWMRQASGAPAGEVVLGTVS